MALNLLLKPQLQRFVDKLFPQIYTYATSSTSIDTIAKIVNLDGFILKRGAHISVRFSDTSSTLPSSGNITLNVNSTGNKSIYISDTDTICDYSYASNFGNGKIQQFVYDGTNWIWINKDYESDALITSSEFENLD